MNTYPDKNQMSTQPAAPTGHSPEEGIKINGLEQVIQMLKHADPAFRDSLIKRLTARDPKLAQNLVRYLTAGRR